MKLTVNLPALPLLVVTITTPLAPRTPYTAVAEASFKIEKLSISAGSRVFKSPSTPSISIKAEALAPKVLIPRTQNSEKSLPGSPLRVTPIIPGTRPCNIFETEVAGTCNCAGSTEVIAPTTDTLRCEPRPTTTTSSKLLILCFNTMVSRSLDSVTLTSLLSKPTKEKTTVDLGGTLVKRNFPSKSVMTPMDVPFTATVTPISSYPSSPITVPE